MKEREKRKIYLFVVIQKKKNKRKIINRKV